MKTLLCILTVVCVIFVGKIECAPRGTTTTQIVLPDENFAELNVTGLLTAGSLKITGPIVFGNGLTITGDSVFENISVTGNSFFTTISVSGDSFFENISVADTATINHLSVYGDATLCDNVTICNNLDVGGTLTVPNLNTNLTFTDLSVSGDATVDGNLTVSGTLSLPGSFSPDNIDLVDSTPVLGKITKSGINFIINPGGSNTFVGKNAGTFGLTLGTNNTGFGVNTLSSINTTAQNNTAVGPNGLLNVTTGSYNIGVGSNAGVNYTNTESNNIMIGNNGIIGDNNTIRIGTDGVGLGQQNRCFIAGINGKMVGVSSTVIINSVGQLGTIISSKNFKENIVPISDDITEKFFQMRAVRFNYKDDPEKQIQYGFIAEEIEKLLPELVIYDEDKKPFTIQYHLLYALLHKMTTAIKKRIDLMEEKILALENQFKQLNSR